MLLWCKPCYYATCDIYGSKEIQHLVKSSTVKSRLYPLLSLFIPTSCLYKTFTRADLQCIKKVIVINHYKTVHDLI